MNGVVMNVLDRCPLGMVVVFSALIVLWLALGNGNG